MNLLFLYSDGAGVGSGGFIADLCSDSEPYSWRTSYLDVDDLVTFTATKIPSIFGDLAGLPNDDSIIKCSEDDQVCGTFDKTYMGYIGGGVERWSCCSKDAFKTYFDGITSGGGTFCMADGSE